MSNEDELIDDANDGLTDEERRADAAAVAADMGPFYANIVAEKRKRAAKTGHRKERDKRFRINADGPGVASPSADKTSDPWDQKDIDYDEFFRLLNIIRAHQTPCLGGFRMLPNANIDRIFDQIFQDRARTPDNLLRLYRFMNLKHKDGFPALTGQPVYDVVVKILVKEGLLEEPASEWAAGDPKTWIEYDSEGKIK